MQSNVLQFPNEYNRLKSQYDKAHEATVAAWQDEIRAAAALEDSKTWKAYAPTWQAYCKEFMPYADSTYRVARMNMPLADYVGVVTETSLTREQANLLGKKLNEIIPSEERAAMRLQVLGLCLAYDESNPVPDRNVIEEAYEILREERDNHTISVAGKTYDYRESAQVARLRERVVQDIQSRSKRISLAIEEKRKKEAILRFAKRLGYNVPMSSKKLFLSYED